MDEKDINPHFVKYENGTSYFEVNDDFENDDTLITDDSIVFVPYEHYLKPRYAGDVREMEISEVLKIVCHNS